MASLLENLVDVLDRENTEYEKLLTLAEQKTPAVVQGDLATITQITEDEQEIVGRLQTMEKQRMKALAEIANVVNRDVEHMKLKDLIQMLDKMPKQQEQLKGIHERLKITIDRLKEANSRNQLLLEDKLKTVEFDLNVIRAANSAPQTANYSKDANTNGQVLGIFHGGFDAKQ